MMEGDERDDGLESGLLVTVEGIGKGMNVQQLLSGKAAEDQCLRDWRAGLARRVSIDGIVVEDSNEFKGEGGDKKRREMSWEDLKSFWEKHLLAKIEAENDKKAMLGYMAGFLHQQGILYAVQSSLARFLTEHGCYIDADAYKKGTTVNLIPSSDGFLIEEKMTINAIKAPGEKDEFINQLKQPVVVTAKYHVVLENNKPRFVVDEVALFEKVDHGIMKPVAAIALTPAVPEPRSSGSSRVADEVEKVDHDGMEPEAIALTDESKTPVVISRQGLLEMLKEFFAKIMVAIFKKSITTTPDLSENKKENHPPIHDFLLEPVL